MSFGQLLSSSKELSCLVLLPQMDKVELRVDSHDPFRSGKSPRGDPQEHSTKRSNESAPTGSVLYTGSPAPFRKTCTKSVRGLACLHGKTASSLSVWWSYPGKGTILIPTPSLALRSCGRNGRWLICFAKRPLRFVADRLVRALTLCVCEKSGRQGGKMRDLCEAGNLWLEQRVLFLRFSRTLLSLFLRTALVGRRVAVEEPGDHMGRINDLAARDPGRLHYLDWLRVLAVAGVFVAHALSICNLLAWHVNERRTNTLVVFGTEWGMALFFFLAGASAWFSLDARTGRQFVRERFLRLVIPFGVGIMLLSPMQGFLLGVGRAGFAGSFFQYYPYFFTHIQLAWNPQVLAAYGFHLWFLAFLFLFSLFALVPFLFLKRPPGQRLVAHLSELCTHRGGFFLLLWPLALIQLALRPAFPAYQGWTDFLIWFIYFVYGYLLLSNARLVKALRKQGGIALLVGVVSTGILLVTMYAPGIFALWDDTIGYTLTYELYQVLWTVAGWSWMLFVLVFGMRFLNVRNRVITYLNEALLPFYVLHYSVIVLVASGFVPWQWPPPLQFVVVSTLSLVGTLLLYELVVRHVPFVRWLFGMKPAQGQGKGVLSSREV